MAQSGAYHTDFHSTVALQHLQARLTYIVPLQPVPINLMPACYRPERMITQAETIDIKLAAT